MALIQCPECSGTVSDKAHACPHCGYPMAMGNTTHVPTARKSRRRRTRRPNGSGTIVKMSGKRKNPFQVRVNTYINEDGYPRYDVLGNFPDQLSAEIALADFNKDPYDPKEREKTFLQIFEAWYRWKFKKSHEEKGKTSSQACYTAAFKKFDKLHPVSIRKIRADDIQDILDNGGCSHSMQEHMVNLVRQMYKYCLQYEILEKDYAKFVRINKEDDDEHGVPFTTPELRTMWEHKDYPFVDTVLILCYTGFRINELARMPMENINLTEKTLTGGLKTRFSRDRVVPIHPDIFPLIKARSGKFKSILYHDGIRDINEAAYRQRFAAALTHCGITGKHTPHDCRHTFNTLLDQCGADTVSRYILMGHKGKDINENVYTHKNMEQLRNAVNLISLN